MSKGSKEQSIIREQTIEYIARQFADHRTGTQIATLLGSWGVPNSLIDFKNTKWRMLYDLFRYYSYSSDKKDHETLFKIIGEILHPLMFGGDKALSEKTARNFNKYLEYDGVVATYSNDDKKYYVYRKEDVDIDNQEIDSLMNERFFQEQHTQLGFLRQPDNKEKISTLRKAYQALMNLTELFCQNPSRPTHELNDAYLKAKSLVIDAVNDLHLYVDSVNGEQQIYKLRRFFIPFTNLFTAEDEYTVGALDIDLSGKSLTWNYIRPYMHATYGAIDDLFREVDGSDVLSKPDVQQTLNDVSLLLSKTKEENRKSIETKQKTSLKQKPVKKLEILHKYEPKISNRKSLKDSVVRFDDTVPAIFVDEVEIRLPEYGKEHYLCRAMWKRKANEAIDWSIIYSEMDGRSVDILPDKELWRYVYDAKNDLNNRVKEITATTENLFGWKDKTIRRMY